PEVYTLSLPDALPICADAIGLFVEVHVGHALPLSILDPKARFVAADRPGQGEAPDWGPRLRHPAIGTNGERRSSRELRNNASQRDRKSTRLNSSHVKI